MPDYANGKIYKIVNSVNDKVYIGSTTKTLAQRLNGHRYDSKILGSKFLTAMRRHGVDNFRIELIKNAPCSSKTELEKIEFKVTNKFKDQGITLYNSRFDGKRDKKSSELMIGVTHPRFNRGSIRRVTERGLSRWSFRWQEDGKTRSKTFSEIKYGDEEAKRLVEEYRDKIYPIE